MIYLWFALAWLFCLRKDKDGDRQRAIDQGEPFWKE